MAKFFQNKNDFVFLLTAISLFIFLAAFAIYSATFLVEAIGSATNSHLIKTGEIVNFNLNKAKQLQR